MDRVIGGLATVAGAGILLAVPAMLPAGGHAGTARVYPDRWVFVMRSLRRDGEVEEIRRIARTAAEHGLNGLVLSGGLDALDLQPPEYFRRLEAVKEICRENQLELIPQVFSAGYGGAVLQHDRNLAEGLPVEDARFVVRGREARVVPDPTVRIENGGFETSEGDRLQGFTLQDQPGQLSFVDTHTVHEGHASLRLEPGARAGAERQTRVMQEVAVRPRRSYRFTCWIKTAGLKPAGMIQLAVYAGRRHLLSIQPSVAESADWQRATLLFNSLQYDRVRLYAGVWGAREGKVWLDDLRLEESGPVNVLRRPGTPVTVRSEDGRTIYQEGKDYAPLVDPQLSPSRPDHDAPPLAILPGSRIRDGEQLRVSWYHPVALNRGQVSICMSEPKVYQIWRTQARLLRQHLHPQKFLLSMDEIRAGGSCAACKARKQSMAEILGDCITRQMALLREFNTGAAVYCWSDMLDPNHNAHGDYYSVEGDYTGSWQHVPKDLIIVCWYYEKRDASLKFFSGLNFQTLAGAYYDGDTLENPQGWLQALDNTSNARGILYTTWQNKYDLLPGFGDLVAMR